MFDINLLFTLYIIPSMLIAASVHEFSHAWMAAKLGDYTAKAEGRLTLNPLVHIDPLGLLAMIIFKIGWAKPVPINPYNFAKPVRDEALVAVAGPISNVIQVVLGIILFLVFKELLAVTFILEFIWVYIFVNVVLAVFNMIPIAPLDGYSLLKLFSPASLRYYLQEFEKYSYILLLLIVLPFSPLRPIVTGIFSFVFGYVLGFVGDIIGVSTPFT